jgi:hypothetical protein
MKINGIKYDYKEIFNAWITARNPSDDEKKLAERRYYICSNCELKKSVIKNQKWSEYCKGCGCPLNKKIFTKIYNSCPLLKWEECDNGFIEKIEDKREKSII